MHGRFYVKIEPWDFFRKTIVFWDFLGLVLGKFEICIWQHCTDQKPAISELVNVCLERQIK